MLHYERMLFDLTGKTALVTGGSRGIGMMIARGFLDAGAKVCISSRSAQGCEEAVAELSKHGEVFAIPANLSTREECERLIAEFSQREPQLPEEVTVGFLLGAAERSRARESGEGGRVGSGADGAVPVAGAAAGVAEGARPGWLRPR